MCLSVASVLYIYKLTSLTPPLATPLATPPPAHPPLVTSVAQPPRNPSPFLHPGYSLSQQQLTDAHGTATLGLGGLSQDSVLPPRGPTPPPLPPRPLESSSDEDDPDYAYIDEGEVNGRRNGSAGEERRSGSLSVDEQLEEIWKDIKKENRAKRRATAVAKRQRGLPQPLPSAVIVGPRVPFSPADAEDYLIPVPSKRIQENQNQSNNSKSPVPSASSRPSRVDSDILPPAGHSPSQPVAPGSGGAGPWQRRPSPLRPPAHEPNAPALPPRTWTTAAEGEGEASGSCVCLADRSKPTTPTAGEDSNQEEGVASKATPTGDTHSDKEADDNDEGLTFEAPPTEDPAFVGRGDEVGVAEKAPDGGSPEPTAVDETADTGPAALSPAPPPLPPRSPIKEKLSWHSSSSSVSCPSSSRCPRCHSRRHHVLVEKTSSLNDHRPHPLSPREDAGPKGSLPNLSHAAPAAENSLCQHPRHACQQKSRLSSESSCETLPSAPHTPHTSTPSLPPTSSPLVHSKHSPADGTPDPSYLQLVGSTSGPPVAMETSHSSSGQSLEGGAKFNTLPSPRQQKKETEPNPSTSAQEEPNSSSLARGPAERLANGHSPCMRLSRGPLQHFDTVPAFPTISSPSSAQAATPPPVPPRSIISLTHSDPLATHSPVGRSRSAGRQVSYSSRAHHSRTQYDASGSSTVFFHHLNRHSPQAISRHVPQATQI